MYLSKSAPVAFTAIDEQNARPKYRSDIDGLRALSILAVVGYHIFPNWVTGGFVGVDIFFVISGFLISTIIFQSLRDDKFSFIEFYAHRVRRIFPALILVMACCLILGWYVLLPSEFEYLGKHIAASAAFVQNIVLSRESGYFDIASDLKPLNHLWSLAIEEQFYAIFPLLMWGAWRLRIDLLTLVAAICGISFIVNTVDVHYDPTATFFLLRGRAWELMAGALLAGAMLGIPRGNRFQFSRSYGPWVKISAFCRKLVPEGPSRPHTQTSLVDSLLSLAGLGLILYAVFGFDRTMPYPGAWAVVPVLGGILLIFSGTNACVNRLLLSNRVMVFIGLISYPLYLWHWPLLSYLTIIDNASPPLNVRVLVAVVSIVMAWLTYRFIERPIRVNKRLRTTAAASLPVAMALLLGLGLDAKHFYRDYDSATTNIIQAWNFQGYPDAYGMHGDKRYDLSALGHGTSNRILFVGDSHAWQYWETFADLLKGRSGDSTELLVVLPKGFPPELPNGVFGDPTISIVVFSYFWALNYGTSKVDRHRIPPATSSEMDQLDRRWEALTKSLLKAGKRVYFVLDNPFGREIEPRFLVQRSLLHGIRIMITPLPKTRAMSRDEPVRSRLLKIVQETGSQAIDPMQYLCDATLCPALYPDGMPIYKDYDHLSDETVIKHVRYLDVLVTPPFRASASSNLANPHPGTIDSGAAER